MLLAGKAAAKGHLGASLTHRVSLRPDSLNRMNTNARSLLDNMSVLMAQKTLQQHLMESTLDAVVRMSATVERANNKAVCNALHQ